MKEPYGTLPTFVRPPVLPPSVGVVVGGVVVVGVSDPPVQLPYPLWQPVPVVDS